MKIASGSNRVSLFGLCLAVAGLVTAAENWPAFRGPSASGVGEQAVAKEFNADEVAGPLKNILWKVAVPGLSHSSPIVCKLFVAKAVRKVGEAPLKVGLYGAGDSADDDTEQSWKIYCLDKKTGKLLWERTAHNGDYAGLACGFRRSDLLSDTWACRCDWELKVD